MEIAIIILSILLLSCFIYLIVREKNYRENIEKADKILDEIIKTQNEIKILVDEKNPLAPLFFKINKLIEKDKEEIIKANKNEKIRKQMLTDLSHDVRTPLASVLGYLDALNSGIAGSEKEEYLHIIYKKAYSLKEYIDELFLISQLDSNDLIIDFKKLDLFELLRVELLNWYPIFQKDNIKVEVDIPDIECNISGNEHYISRVFNNLIQNALRYGMENNYIGIKAYMNNDTAFFEISDKGKGFNDDEKNKVFTRLYKRDNQNKSGNGLGLFITKELISRMKGKIELNSIPYEKTSFTVSLPLCKNK
jgi:signal transduction histidine kinase